MEKTVQRGASWFILYTKYYLGEQNKNDGISGHVVLNGEKRNAYKVLGRKSEKKKQTIDGKIILKLMLKTGLEGRDLIKLILEMTNKMQLCRTIYYSIVP